LQFWTTLATVSSIFLLLFVGCLARKTGALKSEDVSVVNSLLINLTMPAFIFVSTHNKPLTAQMIKVPVLGIGVELVVIGLAYIAGRALRLNGPTIGALILVSTFGNTGFLGYPMVKAAFNGDRQAILTAVLFDSFAMALTLQTLGAAIAAASSREKFSWSATAQFLKTPLLPTTAIALALRTVPVPTVIMNSLNFLAAGTIPLAMISVGLSLHYSSVKQMPVPIFVAMALKLAVLPLLMSLIVPYAGVTGVVGKVAIVESATPAAVFSGVIAGQFGANRDFAAAAIFVTTLVSAITIPAVLLILS
jgi:predicted permease